MSRRKPLAWIQISVLLLWVGTAAALGAEQPVSETARELIEGAGVTGGLVVHLGCGDGRLTAALRLNESFVVQGLDPDQADVEAARRYVQSQGLYGPVSVERLEGRRLPYVDNLVRLLVAEDLCGVSLEELQRVLAPLGVAYIKRRGGWQKIVKPWPDGMDEWPQHFYGPDNNAVSKDRLVGPPRRFQWISQPEWMRSHMTMPSITSMVSARGRLFTIEDEGSIEHPALPGRFALVARDAFNGVTLWKRRFPDWHPITIRTKLTPVQLQRRLAAIGDVVYCTPGFTAPITALDAATGRTQKVFSGTERTTEFVYDRGVLFAVIGDPTDTLGIAQGSPLGDSLFPAAAYGPKIPVREKPKSRIVALDAETGRVLWEVGENQTEGYQGGSLAVRGDRVVFATSQELVCLDRSTGRTLWRTPAPIVLKDQIGIGGAGVSLVLTDQAAYLADSQTVRAFSLDDGRQLWSGKATLNHHKPPDLFVVGGVVWSNYFDGHDPLTGRIVRRLQQQMTGPMGHDRCYRNRITVRYYINSKTGGCDFLGLEQAGEFPNPWVRSTCGIGYAPCNGLLYCGPAACSCCNWVMLNAMNALAPEPGLKASGQVPLVKEVLQLEKGPAYSWAAEAGPAAGADAWPTYRHDSGRSGVTRSPGPKQLRLLWRAKLTTRPSAPVIAAGRVFVADVDAHAVCALDAKDGHLLWRVTTGARVDSPPTYYKGLLLFGSHDGAVYCLRASDGALVWRFRPLPADRMICAYGQVESAWPISGSVLLQNGLVYFVAGRNSFVDGGVFLYALEPESGRVVYKRRLYGPYDENGFPIITSHLANGSAIDGVRADILLSDGKFIYLRQQAFKFDLTPLRPDEPRPAHLITNPGFLEGIPHHRTFWTIDTTSRYDITAGLQASHGDILVYQGRRFYEVRGYTPARISPFDPRKNGYTLFAGVYQPANQTRLQKRGRRAPKRLRIFSKAEPLWTTYIPLTGKALALAGDQIFVAGTPVVFPPDDLAKAYEGRMGGVLWAGSATTGQKTAQVKLDAPPCWDSLAAADGHLFLSLQDGSVLCFGEE